MNIIAQKVKDVFFSVLPIIIIVLILHFTVSPIETAMLFRFLLGSFFVMIGLVIFLLGVDIAITPLGTLTGSTLAKTNKLWIVLIAGFILGFFISLAEPGLLVLANQVDFVTSGQVSSLTLLIVVSFGLALMLAFGFLRIFYNIPLYKILIVLYGIIFLLAIFVSEGFLAISFDSSGSTTGILAVPFILALSVGVSKMKRDSKASEKDSFGLVAIASTGAIISVLLLDIFSVSDFSSVNMATEITATDKILAPFLDIILPNTMDSLLAILPLFMILIVLQILFFKLKKREMRKLLTGFGFSFIGLLIFLVGVNGGFMDVGSSIGTTLATIDQKIFIIISAFVIGVVTILAEPAVYVLTQQIEDVTSGYVKKQTVLIPLAIGVGIAILLSILRVLVPGLKLWHYLLPGYLISLGLMFITPKLFVGIAFDAGGVATGPITATFILAFIHGAANAYEGADLIIDGFGMIAMVAMIPIITLELLGLVYKFKTRRKGDEYNESPK